MFFGNGILCEYDPNGFYQLSCIQAHCSNVDCKTTNPFSETDLKQGDISFNQYVVDTYTYKNRKGENKQGTRTVRKTFIEPFKEFEQKLFAKGKAYLLHRYECKNDVYHWPVIKSNGLGYTMHMDYSENISTTPKHEPQDAYFSSKQVSLHCTVVHNENPDVPYYAYHISDRKKPSML